MNSWAHSLLLLVILGLSTSCALGAAVEVDGMPGLGVVVAPFCAMIAFLPSIWCGVCCPGRNQNFFILFGSVPCLVFQTWASVDVAPLAPWIFVTSLWATASLLVSIAFSLSQMISPKKYETIV